jgi:hypothetical protein
MLKPASSLDSARFMSIAKNMSWMGYKLFHFVSFFNSSPCLIPLIGPEPSEQEPHRVTAMALTK